jgi:hypothetical protein
MKSESQSSAQLKFVNYHNWVFLLVWAFIFFWHTGWIIFNTEPATGGDTGSHFWPLVTLLKEALPEGVIRIWNPGNLGGEPHLTHYFPGPYLIMAFLAIILPIGMAFNIGTILPVLLFPISIYWGLKKAGLKEMQPLLGGSLSLIFLYNESFSMWGGNALSTLAGQFAHLYALCFFAIGAGYYIQGLQNSKISIRAIFFFAAVLICHFYVALFIPIFFIGSLLVKNQLKTNFKISFYTGLTALLLSAWFVIPMLDNSPWNTAFGLKWHSKNIFLEAFPFSTWPALVLLAASGFYTIFSRKRFFQEPTQVLLSSTFIVLALFAMAFYFLFPRWGLVDIRIFPILYLSICFLVPLFLSYWSQDLFPFFQRNFILTLLSGALIVWALGLIKNFPGWVQWNYSSWSSKMSFKDLQGLSLDLKGTFSDPRVIYENSELSNSAGTMRVFEMLPYFAGRSTWESVYMQATILAPAAFYLQALISKTPSCPFPNYLCTSFEPARLNDYAQLMAVKDLILINEEVIEKANSVSGWEKKNQHGLWHHFQIQQNVSYVDWPSSQPEKIERRQFKQIFYDWFLNYKPEQSYLVALREDEMTTEFQLKGKEDPCQAQVDVKFNKIDLKTTCPGKLHVLKFAFHPTFKSSGGEELYLMSPGFIGIVPAKTSTTLTWGKSHLWNLASFISWLTFIGLLVIGIKFHLKKTERKV